MSRKLAVQKAPFAEGIDHVCMLVYEHAAADDASEYVD